MSILVTAVLTRFLTLIARNNINLMSNKATTA